MLKQKSASVFHIRKSYRKSMFHLLANRVIIDIDNTIKPNVIFLVCKGAGAKWDNTIRSVIRRKTYEVL